jgi:hypothetical protein
MLVEPETLEVTGALARPEDLSSFQQMLSNVIAK